MRSQAKPGINGTHDSFGALMEITSRPPVVFVEGRGSWLRDQGAEVESGPREYDYTPGYYAVFLFDPDGIKLELLHRPVA